MRYSDLFIALLVGSIVALLLFGFVFVTGRTFWQRCAAAGYEGVKWYECVQHLSTRKQ